MPWPPRTTAISGCLHHLLCWTREMSIWEVTRAPQIQLGTGLLRVLREQIRGLKLISSQARSLSGCSPEGSTALQWGSLWKSHAGMLGYPLGFRQPKFSLKYILQVQTNTARKLAQLPYFPHRVAEEFDSAERQKGLCMSRQLYGPDCAG